MYDLLKKKKKKKNILIGGVDSIMVIVIGSGLDYSSSNPEGSSMYFT